MPDVDVQKFMNLLTQQLGKPYEWGDEGPDSFDCSGLVEYMFTSFGVQIPRVARQQQAATQRISASDAHLGDLVFYGQPAHHVGIYIGSGLMVDAPDKNQKVRTEGVGDATNYGRVNNVTWTNVPGGKFLPGGGVLHPSVADSTPGANTIIDWAKGLAKFLASLNDPHTWLRLGQAVLGIILIGIGTSELTTNIPVANKIARATRAQVGGSK